MKSANADEIFGFASDEIKSTHSPSRRISSNEVGFHCRRRFHPAVRVDLVKKDLVERQGLFLAERVKRKLNVGAPTPIELKLGEFNALEIKPLDKLEFVYLLEYVYFAIKVCSILSSVVSAKRVLS